MTAPLDHQLFSVKYSSMFAVMSVLCHATVIVAVLGETGEENNLLSCIIGLLLTS